MPMPRLPVSIILTASVRTPDRRVENSMSPFAALKFWFTTEVMDAVVVDRLVVSRVLNDILAAVLVAEA